jgi:hypothetical protein
MSLTSDEERAYHLLPIIIVGTLVFASAWTLDRQIADPRRLTGEVAMEFAVLMIALGVAVSPAPERRDVLLAIFGTGLAWLMIWLLLSICLYRATDSVASDGMRYVFPICALGSGAIFGLVEYGRRGTKRTTTLTGALTGLLAALAVACALASVQLVAGRLLRGDTATFTLFLAMLFVLPGIVTGALWNRVILWRQRS